MNNKGFTLIELLATIFLLSIISIISFVSITKTIEKNKDNNCIALESSIINATKDYISDNRYSLNEKEFTKTAKFLQDNNYLKGSINNPYDNSKIDATNILIHITLNDNYNPNTIEVTGLPNNCNK